MVNYCAATGLLHDGGHVTGLTCEDRETGRAYTLRARCVINAAGVWVDTFRQKDGEAIGRPVRPMVAPSQGVHLVVDREFWPADHALLVPKTADGRVLFAVPWLGKVILGTTDTPRDDLPREPAPFREEVEFILREAGRYLARSPRRDDVKSVWVGLRPLVKPQGDDGEDTKGLSREHSVLISRSGLVTVTGGKWTTYRAMAEDVLERCFAARLLSRAAGGVTEDLRLVGGDVDATAFEGRQSLVDAAGVAAYGSEAAIVGGLDGADRWLAPSLTEAMVRFAARYEYARCVEDVLARRHRMLFLDARLAVETAPAVAAVLESETGKDPQRAAFTSLAAGYLLAAR